MRVRSTRQPYLSLCAPSSTTKVVVEYCGKYEAINQILLDNPALLDCAHAEFVIWLSDSEDGRESVYTSEELLRTLVVLFIEGDSYRGVVIRVETCEFLRTFIGFGICKPMMNFGLVSKAFSALSEKTWQTMNELLGRYARSEGKITGDKARIDTTAYEANIHYPTDSSLLWDSYRVLSRLLQELQQQYPELNLNHRYHGDKVKKLAQSIARNAGSKSKSKQKMVKAWYRTLLERVRAIVENAHNVKPVSSSTLVAVVVLDHFTVLAERVIDQAHRRIILGEQVPADEKLYSLFEEHVELLIRGKAGKPIEFGHMLVLMQSSEKFITYYRCLPKREEDPALIDEALKAHRKLFEDALNGLAADKGFYKSVDQLATLEKTIETVSICKKGRLTQEQREREHTEDFEEGQRFRAGIEGSISVLKRAFKLNRCLFKGFKNFAASVGCAIFCHNLVLLTRL
jgi:IS5 family transposase